MNPLLARLQKIQEKAAPQTVETPPTPIPTPQTPPISNPSNPSFDFTGGLLDKAVGATNPSTSNSATYATLDDALAACINSCMNLGVALQEQNPDMGIYLPEINLQLREYPELVQLLTDEQIFPLYRALRARTGVAISVAKSKSSKKAGLLSDGQSIGSLL